MTTDPRLLTRRSLLRTTALATGALALGPTFWKRAVASAATVAQGPYGPLAATPDANGFLLPEGFTSRLVARAGEIVPGTSYRFPTAPDGQATFRLPDGGWILATNAEAAAPVGGVSATRFGKDGAIQDAYRILTGTNRNCSGGPTPWGTWLSCEEADGGAVWECDPTQPSQGVRRPALGIFVHEAAAVDSVGQRVYLTEDAGDGGLYRFTPTTYPLLDEGVLEVAVVAADGRVTWVPVPQPQPTGADTPTRKQVPEMTQFKRGEGLWFDSGIVYVATTQDARIHAYDTVAERVEVIYDKAALAAPPLTGIDNLTVAPSGDLFVCEDNGGAGGTVDIGLLTPDRTVSRFASATGPQHVFRDELGAIVGSSELTGPVFDPSGTRLYVSSQRALPAGAVYEITGPFRTRTRPAAGAATVVAAPPREPGQAVGSGQERSLPVAPQIGSALGLEVPRRVSLSRARRRGIPVSLTLTQPEAVTITTRARFRPLRARRRRTYTLGRRSRRFTAQGPHRLDVPLTRAAGRLLRGRRGTLRVVVEVRVGDASLRRTVLLTPR
jgi:secreted PhoX family phosphatase